MTVSMLQQVSRVQVLPTTHPNMIINRHGENREEAFTVASVRKRLSIMRASTEQLSEAIVLDDHVSCQPRGRTSCPGWMVIPGQG